MNQDAANKWLWQRVENGADPRDPVQHTDLKVALCETFSIAADRAEWAIAKWLVSYTKEVNVIKYLPKGTNIFSVDANVLVCPVNTKGVMGAGLAKQFAAIYPGQSRQYINACNADRIKPGDCFFSEHESYEHELAFIATKDHWKYPSQLEWVEAGVQSLAQQNDTRYSWIAMPAIGCGLGGLPWISVQEVLERVLSKCDFTTYIIPPQ